MGIQPMSGYSSFKATDHGTTYFYKGLAAGKLVGMASAAQEAAMAANQQDKCTNILGEYEKKHPTGDVIVMGSVLAVVGAIVGVVGAIAGVASAAAGTVSAVSSVTALALGQSDKGTQAMEINVHNNTIAPLVCYQCNTTGCSNASFLQPILPGASGGMGILSNNASGFSDSSSSVDLDFLVGSGAYTPNGSEQLSILEGINARVTLAYDSDWYPVFTIDGGSSLSDRHTDGLTAICFIPKESSNSIGFTLVSGLVEKASASLDITFLPMVGVQS